MVQNRSKSGPKVVQKYQRYSTEVTSVLPHWLVVSLPHCHTVPVCNCVSSSHSFLLAAGAWGKNEEGPWRVLKQKVVQNQSKTSPKVVQRWSQTSPKVVQNQSKTSPKVVQT